MDKKISIAVLIAGLLLGAAIIQAESVGIGNSSVLLKRESAGLFVLTISDPQGIKEFSLQQPGKPSYGGGVDCPRTFQNNNVVFSIEDFTPDMEADVLDCAGNRDEFKIGPPKDGITRGVRVSKPVPEEEKIAPSGKKAPAAEAGAEEEALHAKKIKAISYPIPELGNCTSADTCRVFCDDVANINACVAFADTKGLLTLSKDEVDIAKKIADTPVSERPGGCTSWDSCTAYCEDAAHLEECVAFSERSGLLPADELQEAKTVLKLRQEGVSFPGGCTTKAQCEEYCTESGNAEECIAFAEKSGLIPPAELEQAKKMLPLIQQGKTPGGCKTKAQCESYCSESANIRKCLVFAEENDILPKEELEMAKKFLPLMEQGKTPGGCKTKEQCETYCGEGEHFEECISFGEEAGFISKADAEIARKTGGKGPGDCKSKEECEAFCKDPANQETCTAFASEHGIEVGGPGGCKNIDECRAYCSDKAHQDECEGFSKERGLDITGPGGCQGKDQCAAYCTSPEHQDECGAFMKEQGIEFNGPGGCKSQEECQAYCQAPEHQQECQSFTGGQGGGGSGGGLPGGGGGGTGAGPVGPPPSGCSFEELSPVCAEASPGKHHTFNNECFAKAYGATNLRPGVCPGDVPCSTVRDTVCAIKGEVTQSYFNRCAAEGDDASILYPGECKSEGQAPFPTSGGGLPGGGGGGSGGGPGGCTSQEECQVYCQTHYTEPVCGGGGGGTPPPSPTPTTSPPQPTSSCAPLPSGLVSWLDDDTLSSTSGGVTLAPGKVGNALKFDGAGGYVNDGNRASLNFGTAPFSLEAWFNWDGGGSDINNIIRKSNYGPGAGSGYWLRIARYNQTIEFSIGATTGPEGQSLITAPITPGVWHHVAATRDSSDNIKLYVDGQSTGTVIRKASGANSTSESSFALGAWPDQNSEFFSGLIDEVSVYNRALSASEVQAIFNAGSAGKCSIQ